MANTKKTVKKNEESKKKGNEKFALIKLAGSQLKIYEGKEYEVNKLLGEKGDKIEVTEVLLVTDGTEIKVGKPFVKDSKVELEITSQKKGKKVDALVYKAKSRHRRRYGYRPLITRVLVKKIS